MGDTEEAVATAAEEYVEVHLQNEVPVYMEATDNFPDGGFVYKTKCGQIINDPVGLTTTGDADAVTCSACKGA
jgi:hypothetical protein